MSSSGNNIDSGGSQTNKKRKSDTIVNVETNNRFSVLSEDEDNTEEIAENRFSKQRDRLPPVVIYGKLNNEQINFYTSNVQGRINFKFKTFNRFEVYTQTTIDYKKVLELAKLKNQEHYTVTPKSKQVLKFVLKNIPAEFSESEIEEDIKKQEESVLKVKQMVKKINDSEVKLPVYIVHFTPNTNKNNVFAIKSVCYCITKWELFRSKNKILQCFKCQGFGHTSSNCFKIPKCVKCAQPHQSRECNFTSVDEKKCANCQQSHSANDKQCPIYTKIVSSRRPRNPTADVAATQPPVQDLNNFPILSRGNNRPYSAVVKNNTMSSSSSQPIISDEQSSPFIELYNELKNLFSQLDLNKLTNIVTSLVNKIKTTNDLFTKLSNVFEGIVEYNNDP